MPRLLAARLLAVAAVAACSTTPPHLVHAAVIPAVHHTAAPAAPGNAESSPQLLHIDVLVLRDEPVGPAVDLVADRITRHDGTPFHGASTLPAGTRWLTGDALAAIPTAGAALDPAVARPLGAADAVLAADLTTTITFPGSELPMLQLHAAAGPAPRPTAVRILPAHDPATAETVHLPAGLPADGAALFVPARAGALHRGLVVRLTLTAGATVPAEQLAAARATPPAAAAATWPAPWRTAFAAVGAVARRPALLALAAPLQVPHCVDVLAIADETALADITTTLRQVDPAAGDLPWSFERAVWRALLPRLERDELPHALAAACWRHLGAAADDPGMLSLTLTTAADAAAFLAAIVAENVAALGARDAAARVRAHDWLAARGAAVTGFDPLAPAAERRAALLHHAAAPTTREEGR